MPALSHEPDYKDILARADVGDHISLTLRFERGRVWSRSVPVPSGMMADSVLAGG